jgi:L-threonylcarbamoyladenylate synthase
LVWSIEAGTQIMPVLDANSYGAAINAAAGILKQGGLVAFPTETVYGLGADALNPEAVCRIFAAKGRPADNPLIVHIAHPDKMSALAVNIPPEAYLLSRHFWPGPLTLVLESKRTVPSVTTGGLDSVALRIPRHPVALALLNAAGLPIAAPSANLSGSPSPTTARHVLDDLAGRIDAVLDGGPCEVGLESTVLDIRGGQPLILRPGGVTAEEIAKVLGQHCPIAAWQHDTDEPPPSPGLKYTHYAPRAPLYLIIGEKPMVLARLKGLLDHHHSLGNKVGLLLALENSGGLKAEHLEILGTGGDLASAGAALYGSLRRLDEAGVDVILAQGYPETGIGVALMNRLRKAAGQRVIETK